MNTEALKFLKLKFQASHDEPNLLNKIIYFLKESKPMNQVSKINIGVIVSTIYDTSINK